MSVRAGERTVERRPAGEKVRGRLDMQASDGGVARRGFDTGMNSDRPRDSHLLGSSGAEAEVKSLTGQAQRLAGSASVETGQLLQAILDSSTAVVHVKDSQGRYLLVNRRYETLFEVARQDVAGK